MVLVFVCLHGCKLRFNKYVSEEPWQNIGRGLVDRKLVEVTQYLYSWLSQGGSSVFGSLVVLDVCASIYCPAC